MALIELYLVNNGEENIAAQRNPSAQYTLTCDVSGYPEEQMTYSWSCDGCTDTFQVILPEDSRTSGQVETINCTANLSTLAPVTITWNITWHENVTPGVTEVTPVDEPVSGGSLSGGESVGIWVGCCTLIAIAAVADGSVVYKRHKKPSNGVTTDKRGKRNSNKDGKGDECVPMYPQTASAPPGGTGTA